MMAAPNTKYRPVDEKLKLSYLPSKLFHRLMPFQREGVLFGLEKNGRCLIADEMGLGKTIQALSIALHYKSKWPLLIVVPASLRYPWIEEIEKWIPEVHPHDINLIQGGADVEDIPTARITVVTYGLLRHPSSKVVQEALYNHQFEVVIVDESHYIKNRKAVSTKYLVPLLQRATHKILLTGTPALARPEELYPQLDAILPGRFGSWSTYAKKYCDAQWRHFGPSRKKWVTDGASNLEDLQRLMTHHLMIRRLKKNVLTQLPPKQRQRIPFQLKDSVLKKDLESSWDGLHSALGHKDRTLNSVLSGSTLPEDTDAQHPLSSSQPGAPGGMGDGSDPLQVQAPAAVGTVQVFGLLSDLYRRTCAAKVGPVKDYLKMLCQNEGLKFLLFAHHRVMMDSLAEQLMDDGIKFIRIDGSTVMQERPKLVHEFQADTSIRCALLSIKAAGVGLTLTAANLVVFAELDWTPGTLEQCEDRAHRIGQKDPVHVHYLVAKNTLDEWVWSALCRKTTVVTTTLNGETQVLDMDHGNDGQIKCLDNAEAYIPQKKDPDNLAAFLQTQPANQKTIFDFFTPRTKKAKMAQETETTPTTSKPGRSRTRGNFSKNEVVLLDSADEDTEFTSPNTENRVKKKRKLHATQNTHTSDSDDEELGPTTTQETVNGECHPEHDGNDLGCDLDDIPLPKVKRRRTRSRSSLAVVNGNPTVTKETPDGMPRGTEGKGLGEMWSCPRCTYLNHLVLPYCEMCSTPKKTKKTGNSSEPSQKTSAERRASGSLKQSQRSSVGLAVTTNNSSQENQGDITCDNNGDIPLENTVTVVPETDTEFEGYSSAVENSDGLHIDEYPDSCDSSLTGIRAKRRETVRRPTYVGDTIEDYDSVGDNKNSDSCTECVTPRRQLPVRGVSTPASEPCTTPKTKLTDQSDIDDIISAETAAAKKLFSPSFRKASKLSRRPWTCPECHVTNDVASEDCDGCLASRPENMSLESVGSPSGTAASCPARPASRNVDLDTVPVYELFRFCCSKNTSRIYIYDQNDKNLGVNFNPLDVELDNFAELPDVLLRRENLSLVRRFVRDWNNLAPTKRRLVVRSGEIFTSPSMLYEDLKSGRQRTTQRYTTKLDIAKAALSKAEEIGGSVRVIHRPEIPRKKSKISHHKKGVQFDEDSEEEQITVSNEVDIDQINDQMKGIVQAVSDDGTPLCVHCQRPYHRSLVAVNTVKDNPWQTRFCSKLCMDRHWMRSSRTYSVQQVYQEERGVCQLCQLDAHQLFTRVKNTSDLSKRAKIIQESKYRDLKTDTKQRWSDNHNRFWQVDHITPVVEGGGMCDIDNLRTLCVMCHRSVTTEQAKSRAKQRQMKEAAKCGDISAFFQSK